MIWRPQTPPEAPSHWWVLEVSNFHQKRAVLSVAMGCSGFLGNWYLNLFFFFLQKKKMKLNGMLKYQGVLFKKWEVCFWKFQVCCGEQLFCQPQPLAHLMNHYDWRRISHWAGNCCCLYKPRKLVYSVCLKERDKRHSFLRPYCIEGCWSQCQSSSQHFVSWNMWKHKTMGPKVAKCVHKQKT